eukprot:scaffold39202_cov55-Phaeocystis_antarctica.AAC.5
MWLQAEVQVHVVAVSLRLPSISSPAYSVPNGSAAPSALARQYSQPSGVPLGGGEVTRPS